MQIKDILNFLDRSNIQYSFSGNREETIDGFSSLGRYKENTFTWIKKQENIPENFDVSVLKLVFATDGVSGDFRNVISCKESKYAFFSTIEHFYEKNTNKPAIGNFTYIGPNVKLGKNVIIGHNCTLDGEISIGDGTVLWNNITIVNKVVIGKNCEIQSGTVIGHDGFGYTEEDNIKTMVKHFGGVEIGDDVRLGMNNVIARGTIDDTIIGSGTKMSDLCHIGHNNVIEKNCTIINSAFYGSCHTEENSYISYSVIKNQTHLGKNCLVGMASNVLKDVPEGAVVVGNPAKVLRMK